jgi:hypothetical protein
MAVIQCITWYSETTHPQTQTSISKPASTNLIQQPDDKNQQTKNHSQSNISITQRPSVRILSSITKPTRTIILQPVRTSPLTIRP